MEVRENMLEIEIPPSTEDPYDEATEEFIKISGAKLQLEHSLISIKKWEEKWHKPFLATKDKTYDEIIDYIRCMTIKVSNPDPRVYLFIPTEGIKKVIDYINDPMTATWFSDSTNMAIRKGRSEVVTAEIIYYWMISLNIPSEYQKWHLNQLLTLIKVISIKNSPSKKMGKREQARQTAELNKARRAALNSKG